MRGALSRVAAWVLLSALSHAQAPAQRAWDSALIALRGSRGAWKEVPALQETLTALGPEIAHGLFGLLVAGELPASANQGAQPLDPARSLAITLTLELLPRDSLRTLLDEVASSASGEAVRVRSLELLTRLGSASDLQRAARLASGANGVGPPTPALQAAYRETATAILEREPGSLTRFVRELSELDAILLSEAARAISSLGTRAAFEALATVLGRHPEAEPTLLLELRRMGSELVVPPSEKALEPIRAATRGSDPTVATLAASLLQSLDDAGATANLIAMMRQQSGSAHEAARTALRAITRVDLGPSADAWDQWYEAQLRWASEEMEAASRDLVGGTLAQATLAVQQLAACSVLGEGAVQPLLLGLERSESSVVELVCAALGRIGRWSAVPGLIEVLERGQPAARAAAGAALHRITSFDLPPEADTWRFRIASLEGTR